MHELYAIRYLSSTFHQKLVDFLKEDVPLPPNAESVDTTAFAGAISPEWLSDLQTDFGLSEQEARILALQRVLVDSVERCVNGMITDYFLTEFYRSDKNTEYPRLAQIELLPDPNDLVPPGFFDEE